VSSGLLLERESGVFLRLATAPGAKAAWLGLSVLTPWVLYGVPSAALTWLLFRSAPAFFGSLAAFALYSALGVLFACKLTGTGKYRAAILCALLAGALARLSV